MQLLAKTQVNHHLEHGFGWLEQIIIRRLKGHRPEKTLQDNGQTNGVFSQQIPDLSILQNATAWEKAILLLALLPHVYPQKLDSIFSKYLKSSGDYPEYGGQRGKQFRGFMPTGETAMFLLAGQAVHQRFEVQELFSSEHYFSKNQILWLETTPPGEPPMCGKIIISPEYVDLLTTGKISRPRFGVNFPAQLIETKLNWNDLVLPGETLEQITHLQHWLMYSEILMKDWGMSRNFKPGYRVLFHGPPGTGKTLTSSLLGHYTGKDVYRIDLSMVVSKFIGETEKNLANLFDKAENKDWILFFDEADALFGKRTNVRDAHDKYANQEVSFLLQRTENYSGLVILATNFKNNIDDAFSRRFQSHIYFPKPKYPERFKLWQQAFPESVRLEEGIDLSSLARQYELTGAHIMNVVHYACLQTFAKNKEIISYSDLLNGIKAEFSKEGKIV